MDRDGLIRRLRHWAFRWIGRPTAGASNASLPVASRAENVNPVIPSEDNIPPMARRSAQIPENHAREESVGSSTPPELRTQDRDSTADQQTGGRLATISQPSTRLSDDDEHHSGKGQAEGKNMGFELKNVPRSGDTESAVSDFDSAYSDLKKLWIRTMAAYHINIGLTDEEAVQPAITDRLNSDRRSNLHSSYHMVRLPLGLEMLYRRFRMRFGESSGVQTVQTLFYATELLNYVLNNRFSYDQGDIVNRWFECEIKDIHNSFLSVGETWRAEFSMVGIIMILVGICGMLTKNALNPLTRWDPDPFFSGIDKKADETIKYILELTKDQVHPVFVSSHWMNFSRRALPIEGQILQKIYAFLSLDQAFHLSSPNLMETEDVRILDTAIYGLERLVRNSSPNEMMWRKDLVSAVERLVEKDLTINEWTQLLLRLHPDNEVLVTYLVKSLRDKGSLETTIRMWTQLLEQHAPNKILRAVASAYNEIGGWDGPMAVVDDLIERTKDTSKWVLPINFISLLEFDKRNDADQAMIFITLWNKLLLAYPKEAGLLSELESTLRSKGIGFQMETLKNLFLSHSTNLSLLTLLQRTHEKNKNRQATIRTFHELVSKRPSNRSLQAYLSLLYSFEEDPDLAISGWEALVREHPSEETLQLKLTEAYKIRGPDVAISGWEALVHEHPSEETLQLKLNEAYKIWGPDVAISGWTKLLHVHPSVLSLQDRLAAALDQKGNNDLAVESWQELVRNYPDQLSLRDRLAAAYTAKHANAEIIVHLLLRYPTSVMQAFTEKANELSAELAEPLNGGLEVMAGYDILPPNVKLVSEDDNDFFTGLRETVWFEICDFPKEKLIPVIRNISTVLSPFPIAVLDASNRHVVYVHDSFSRIIPSETSSSAQTGNTRSVVGVSRELAQLREPSQGTSMSFRQMRPANPILGRDGNAETSEHPSIASSTTLTAATPSIATPGPSPGPENSHTRESVPFVGLLKLKDSSDIEQNVQIQFELDITTKDGKNPRSQILTETTVTDLTLSFEDATFRGEQMTTRPQVPHLKATRLCLSMQPEAEADKEKCILLSQYPHLDFTDNNVSKSNNQSITLKAVATVMPSIESDVTLSRGNTVEQIPLEQAFDGKDFGKVAGRFYWYYNLATRSVYTKSLTLPPHRSIVKYSAQTPITKEIIRADVHLEVNPEAKPSRLSKDRQTPKVLSMKYRGVKLSLIVEVQKDPRKRFIQLLDDDAIGPTVVLPHTLHSENSKWKAESQENELAKASLVLTPKK